MKIICSGCSKKLNIPDEKIPADRELKLNCPNCQTALTVSANTPSEESDGLLPELGDSIPDKTPTPRLDETQDIAVPLK
jgi:DNA-directed RNA polymerase subunit RPC12/RpoP